MKKAHRHTITLANHQIIKSIIFLLIISAASWFIIFRNEGKFPIRMWDEATYANNAIDMASGGSLLTVEHLGKPDNYNSKPPFVIWMQALSMKLVGINEWGVRLPSAIFGFLTVLLVFYFCKIVIGSCLAGFISAIVLLTSRGFISNHVVRTGDLDATLVFWLTAGLFLFIYLVENKPVNKLSVYIMIALCVAFGFLTKGIAGFFFIPFMVIIALLFGNHYMFKEKQVYISVVITIIICIGYYLLREFNTPGYLMQVWESEISRYGSEVMSWHVHPFDYYFQNLRNERFTPFIYYLPLTVICLFFLKEKKLRLLVYLFIAAIGYFFLISYPAVKLGWYDAPLFPLLAVITGFSFVEIGRKLFLLFKIENNFVIQCSTLLVVMILLIGPFKTISDTVAYPEAGIYDLELEGAFIKYLMDTEPEIKSITVFKKEKNIEIYDQVVFYQRKYQVENRAEIRISEKADFKKGELVMAYKSEDIQQIESAYKVNKFIIWNKAILYRILE